MKKLPATVSLSPTLEGIQIMDIPEFEELPDNMDKSPLYSIMIMNTGFKAFPKNFEKMKNLRSLSVINSKLTELPIRLSELPEVVMWKSVEMKLLNFRKNWLKNGKRLFRYV